MIDSSDTIDGTPVCDRCEGSLDNGRFVRSEEASVFIFCSADCVRAEMREQNEERWAARRRYARRFTIGVAVVGVLLTPHQGPPGSRRVDDATPVKSGDDSGSLLLPPGWFGPDWPPTDTSLLAVLGRDAWLHPLAGPVRRMPRTDARVFGAVRPGNRAVECRNGHCGVDLGGEIWGEHVRAVHDGVVDFVRRGSNPDHGGRFVRISHRNGTVFSQYFHLAAIPRGLERGVPVKGGDVVGLLGDSGVKESAPHLHFTISVRTFQDGPEKYMDPEPLIALWPLRVPLDGSEVGLVTTVSEPGVPLGSLPQRSGSKKKPAKLKNEKNRSENTEASPMDEEPSPETEAPEPSTDE
jgi:murein DD-endopeptidase MepM/ murein hydrolase activator NlpD